MHETSIRFQRHKFLVLLAFLWIILFYVYNKPVVFGRYLHQPINPDDPPLAPQPRPSHLYRTVGCVFNHKSFLANCQPSDAVELCVFDLREPSLWKSMSEDALLSVCALGSGFSAPPLPPLCGPALDPAAASNHLELEMRLLVSEHRKVPSGRRWSESLS